MARQKDGHDPPRPCTYVDLKNKVAVIKAPQKQWQFIATPTIRVSGIEDRQILEPGFPNYWALAWTAANRLLPSRITKNRTYVGLAINSVEARSQNQLHIHISCVKPGIVNALDSKRDEIGTSWSQFLQLGDYRYRVMRVERASLEHVDPFLLLTKLSGAARDMGLHTLVVTGATWDGGAKRGFYVLEDYAHDTPDGRDVGYGEELLAENCYLGPRKRL